MSVVQFGVVVAPYPAVFTLKAAVLCWSCWSFLVPGQTLPLTTKTPNRTFSLSLLPSPAASRCPFPPLPVDRACSTKGLMYQDQHKKIPSYYKHFVEVMEKNGWKRGETLFGAPYDWRYVVLHSGPPPP